MKMVMMFALTLVLSVLTFGKAEAQNGAAGERFQKVIYVASGGSASCKGLSYACAKPFADGDLWAIPAGTMIDRVYVIIDTAITGTTALTIGDDDSATGFVLNASLTLGTPGLYSYDAKGAGAYLRIQTAGVTDPADVYVVPTAKYYSAAGKEVKLDITTANTAGRMRVVIEGAYMGSK